MDGPSRSTEDPTAALAELTQVVVHQIKMLAKLHDEGVLTDEEFTAKKQELLSRL